MRQICERGRAPISRLITATGKYVGQPLVRTRTSGQTAWHCYKPVDCWMAGRYPKGDLAGGQRHKRCGCSALASCENTDLPSANFIEDETLHFRKRLRRGREAAGGEIPVDRSAAELSCRGFRCADKTSLNGGRVWHTSACGFSAFL